MLDADRGEVDADGAQRAARVGAADRVHRDRLRVAGERLAAPGDVARPGGTVGPVRTVAADAYGILGRAFSQVL